MEKITLSEPGDFREDLTALLGEGMQVFIRHNAKNPTEAIAFCETPENFEGDLLKELEEVFPIVLAQKFKVYQAATADNREDTAIICALPGTAINGKNRGRLTQMCRKYVMMLRETDSEIYLNPEWEVIKLTFGKDEAGFLGSVVIESDGGETKLLVSKLTDCEEQFTAFHSEDIAECLPAHNWLAAWLFAKNKIKGDLLPVTAE